MDKKTLTNFAFNRIMIGILVCILVLSSLYIPIESNIDNPGTSGDNKDNSGSSIYSQNDVTVDYTSEIVIDLEFPKSSISNQNFEGYDILTIPGGEVLYNSGFPSLPYKPITLVLPWDLNIEDIEIKTTAIEQITLEGNYNILPAQEPRPLYEYDPEVESSELIETFEQDQETYDSGSQYPGIIIERVTETDYHAIKLGQFSVFPIQYIPSAQKINLYTKLTVKLTYSEEINAQPKRMIPENSFHELLGNMVANYDDVARFYTYGHDTLPNNSTLESGSRAEPLASKLSPRDVQYVIITNSTNYYSNFYPFAEWKTKKGVPTEIIDDGWIKSLYSGNDTQEKIRNFIRDAKNTWGTKWVLLGGDVAVIPYRSAYCKAGSYPAEPDIAADLYYSDLDGNWDSDNDHVYGEVGDNLNFYSDVYVGRAPVQTGTEVNNFVSKTLGYIKNPPGNYMINATFAGEYLDASTNSSLGLDQIKNNILPPRYSSTSLYDSGHKIYGTLSKLDFKNNMNAGAGLVFHAAHSNYNVMGMGSSSGGSYAWYNSDAMGLSNGGKVGVLYTLGCITTRFNMNDCIAEDHVRNSDGGTVAFIGNSRYGWYSPGSPGNGPSDRFMNRMASEIFNYGNVRVGENFAAGKDYYVTWSSGANTYRWLQYALNLLGDPEMYLWTDVPRSFEVTHSSEVYYGPQTFNVQINDSVTKAPLKDALVCVQGKSIYEYGLTDAAGKVSFQINPTDNKTINVTVTKHNYLPHEGDITDFVTDLNPPQMVVNTNEFGWYNEDPGNVIDVSFDSAGETDLSRAEYARSPSGPWHPIFSTPKAEFTQKWNISEIWPELQEGYNSVSVRCYDSANPNHWVMENITIKKDTIAPVVIINDDTYGWFTTDPGTVIDVDFDNASNVSIGSPLHFAAYSVNSQTGPWDTIFTSPFAKYTNNWAVQWPKLVDGENEILIQVFDEAGNEDFTFDNITILRDSLPPQILIRKNIYGWYSTDPGQVIDVDFSNGGNGSKLDFAQYKISEIGEWKLIFQNGTFNYITNWGVNWSQLKEGDNEILIRCYDSVGHEDNTVDRVTVNKDTTSPQIKINKPVYGWYTSSPGNVIDVDFQNVNPISSPLDFARYRVHTDPSLGTPIIGPWRTIFTNNIDKYTDDWSVDWNDLSEGNNTIEIQIFDDGSNKNATIDTVFVLKDVKPPMMIVNDAQYGWFNSDPGPVIDIDFTNRGTGSNLDYAQYRINNWLWHKICDINDPEYKLNWSVLWSELDEDSNTIEVRIWDEAGFSDSEMITISKDTKNPEITINKGTYGWYNSDPGAVINVDFSNGGECSDLDFAEYKINDKAEWQRIFETGIKEYSAPWIVNWEYLEEGINEIHIRVCDEAGNIYESPTVIKVFRDTMVPSITINRQLYGWYSENPGKVIDIDFFNLPNGLDSGDHSNLTLAQYKISEDGEWWDIFDFESKTYSDDWEVSWFDLSKGENTIFVRVFDAAGNVYSNPELNFTILKDIEPPEILINQQEYGWYNTDPGTVFDVDFDAGITENNSPLAKAQYRIGVYGAWIDIFNSSDGSLLKYTDPWGINWNLAAEGENSVYVRVYDLSGNAMMTYYDPPIFQRDTKGPEAPVLYSPLEATQTLEFRPVHFWLEAKDLGSNMIQQYHIQLDTTESFSNLVVDATTKSFTYAHTTDLTVGRYYWRVRATDIAGNIGAWSDPWSFEVVTIDSPQVNQQPTAIAGEDLVIFVGEEANFNADGSSDPDDDTLIYLWDFNGDLESDVEGISGYWYYYENRTYTVTLEVFDSYGGYDNDTLTVTVLDTEQDTDDDGMSDDWERYYGLDPENPKDAMEDSDNDGYLNTLEFAEGSAPKNELSTPITANDRTLPKIMHSDVKEGQQMISIEITATVVDEDSGLRAVNLYYKKQTDNKYNSISMGITNPYSATIPGSMVTLDNLEYYIEAIDNAKARNTAYYSDDGQVKMRPSETNDIDIDVKEKITFEKETDMVEDFKETFGFESLELCLIVLILLIVLLIAFGGSLAFAVNAKRLRETHESRRTIVVVRGKNMVWEGDEYEKISEDEDLNLLEDDFALGEV